jgi:hypothetical protein
MLSEWRRFKGWVVLEHFLKNPNTKIHTKELSRILKISPRTAGEYLKTYEKDGILKRESVGNMSLYSLNNNSYLVKSLKKTYFLIQLNELEIEDFVNKNEIISLAVYGSFASGEYTKNSDIDFIIISPKKKLNLGKLKVLENIFNTEIDVQIYTLGEWRKMRKENKEFVEHVKSTYVLIYGAEL